MLIILKIKISNIINHKKECRASVLAEQLLQPPEGPPIPMRAVSGLVNRFHRPPEPTRRELFPLAHTQEPLLQELPLHHVLTARLQTPDLKNSLG